MNSYNTPWFYSDKYGELCYKSVDDDQSFGMSLPVDLSSDVILRYIANSVNTNNEAVAILEDFSEIMSACSYLPDTSSTHLKLKELAFKVEDFLGNNK